VDQDGLRMVSVRQRYEGVLGWLKARHVLCLRFEDFITRPDEAFDLMLDEVEKTGYRIPTPRPEARRILRESIQPRKSRTFRSGRVGGWREHFSPEHKRLFLSVAGDLLVRLGYENGDEW